MLSSKIQSLPPHGILPALNSIFKQLPQNPYPASNVAVNKQQMKNHRRKPLGGDNRYHRRNPLDPKNAKRRAWLPAVCSSNRSQSVDRLSSRLRIADRGWGDREGFGVGFCWLFSQAIP